MSIDPRTLLALIPDDDLLAEVHRRRLGRADASVLELGGLRVEPLALSATWRGRTVALTPREAQVLYALALARWQGDAWRRADRVQVKVWRVADRATRACLQITVQRLRAKLPGLIEGRGFGAECVYGLNLDADEVAA